MEHETPNEPTPLSDAADVADKSISFIEDVLGWPLQPWQAETLRAMLTYPVGTRFAVAPGLHHHFTDAPPRQANLVKVWRNGTFVWEARDNGSV